MENVLESSFVVEARVAPYAAITIPLFLTSTTGLRYRTLNCLECGDPFLERNNDSLYRLNDTSAPEHIALNGEALQALCGNCQQKYIVQFSLNVVLENMSIPLSVQPQSVYIAIDSHKKLRYLHCLECGKPFHSISDRISQMVDNRVPFEFVDPNKIGPLEALCHGRHCKQTWSIML